MSEKSDKTLFPEELLNELETELAATISEHQAQRASQPDVLLNKMAEIISDAYCNINEMHRNEIDPKIDNALKDYASITRPGHQEDTSSENMKLKLELYKRITALLADKLNSKSNDKKSLIEKTREGI